MKTKNKKPLHLPGLLAFILFFFIFVWVFHFIVNINHEQRIMKRYVLERMEDPSSYRKVHFDRETVTVGDEIDGKIAYFTVYRDTIGRAVADYRARRSALRASVVDSPLTAGVIRVYDNTCSELEYEVVQCDTMLTFLNGLKKDEKLCGTEVVAVYTLIYEDKGNTRICCGQYDIRKKEFIAMRTDDEPWDILNSYRVSIPGYQEKLIETGFKTLGKDTAPAGSVLPAGQGQDESPAGK